MMCLRQEGKVSISGVCDKGHLQPAPGGDRGLHHGGPFRPRYDILTVEWGGICWPGRVLSTCSGAAVMAALMTLNLGWTDHHLSPSELSRSLVTRWQ